jgi:hypothetical protein
MDVDINAYLGAMHYREKEAGGILFGGLALLRRGLLAGGVSTEMGGLFMSVRSVGAMAGVALRSELRLRLDVLGTSGVHWYQGWGGGLFNDDPGISATLPYAGGLLRAVYAPGDDHGHFCIGLVGGADADLGRARRQYSYTGTDMFNGGIYTANADHTAGGTRYWVALVIGGGFDFAPQPPWSRSDACAPADCP